MSLFSNFPQSPDAGIRGELDALENRVQTVDKGGTGATTAAQALENLGGAAKDLSNVALSVRFEKTAMPTSSDWNSATYGNGKFVALAHGNIAAYSEDGINWTQSTMPTSAAWYSVTYGNGKFVAVAQGRNIAAYSEDGINWTQSTMPISADWSSVTYGNGKFVAVAYDNIAAYSEDGINWTQSTMPISADWRSVTYGNGKFVAVAQGINIAAYSEDGINWTQSTMPTSAAWYSVTYGNGKFVALARNNNKAAYSEDGINWTQSELPTVTAWRSVTYGNGKFVAVAYDNIAAYSEDGINWTQSTMPISADWRSVTYGNGKFVAVAQGINIAAYSITINFIESLTDFGYSKIEVGSYVGTGTYGSNNPCSVSASFPIKRLSLFGIIYADTGNYFPIYEDSSNSSYSMNDILLTTSFASRRGIYKGTSSYGLDYSFGKKSVDGRTFWWYSNANAASYQLNETGITYYYIAIG